MITLIRKPGPEESNREFMKLILPQDNNPHEVAAFLNRFMKLMFPEMDEPSQCEQEKDAVQRAIGIAVSQDTECEEEDYNEEKNIYTNYFIDGVFSISSYSIP